MDLECCRFTISDPSDAVSELEDFYNHAPCGYHALDKSGLVIRMNDLELEWLGYSRDEVVGKMHITRLLAPDSILKFRENFPKLLATGRLESLEFEFRRKDGSFFPVLVNVSAVFSESGEFVQTRAITVDLSNVRRLEQEREGAENQLQHAARLSTLGEMAAGLAHEINQPLAHIKLSAQLIKRLLGGEGSLPEAVLNLLDDMDSSIERASRVIGRVQGFSRTRVTESVEVDLNQTLRSALVFMGEALRKDGVMHALDLSSELPRVQADPHQLEQVWINLISNARDAAVDKPECGEDGPGRTLVIRSRQADSRIEIDFEDNGSGMSESTRQKLFQPFFTTKAPGRGTGLGLSISFSILQSLGGSIAVQSELGRGSCFTVTLPVRQTELQA